MQQPRNDSERDPKTGDTLIGIGDIRVLFKLGRTAAYELTRRPDFPSRVVLSPRCHRWWASEVQDFAVALRDQSAPPKSRASGKAEPALGSRPLRITGRARPVRRGGTA